MQGPLVLQIPETQAIAYEITQATCDYTNNRVLDVRMRHEDSSTNHVKLSQLNDPSIFTIDQAARSLTILATSDT